MAMSTSATAPWTILSSSAGMPSGRRPIGLGDVGSPNRQGPISVRLKARMQRLEIALQFAFIRRHRQSHPRRAPPPRAPKRPFERRHVNVMEQRREPGLARPMDRVGHPNKMPVQGSPALRLDLRASVRAPRWSGPSLRPLVAFAVINGTTPRSADPPPCRA